MTQQSQPRSVSDILNSPASVARITQRATAIIAVDQDAEIARHVACIRQLADEMERLEEAMRAQKAALRPLLAARGASYEDADGYARIVADSARSTYNAKALDDLRLRSKWWDARLRPHFRESTVRGYVSVK